MKWVLTMPRDADPAAGQLLDDHRVGRQVQPHAAVLLGDRDPEQPELLHLLHDRLREAVLVVVMLGVGEDLLVGELADHLADRLLFVGEIGRGAGGCHAGFSTPEVGLGSSRIRDVSAETARIDGVVLLGVGRLSSVYGTTNVPTLRRGCRHRIALAARQHGNVTHDQLTALSASRRRRSPTALRLGRLHRIHHGVFSVGRPPGTPLERAAAAVLACGPNAALSHAGGARPLGLHHPLARRPSMSRSPPAIGAPGASPSTAARVLHRNRHPHPARHPRHQPRPHAARPRPGRLRAKPLARLVNDALRSPFLGRITARRRLSPFPDPRRHRAR